MRYFHFPGLLSFCNCPGNLRRQDHNHRKSRPGNAEEIRQVLVQDRDFVQKTTNIDKDGNQKVETWYEAMSLPGSLRIDFTPTKDGNGILFTNSQIYVFKNGKVDSNRPTFIR